MPQGTKSFGMVSKAGMRLHPLVSVFWLCCPSSAQDALQLYHKMQTALGGAEAIASIRDFDQLVRADTWHNDGRPGAVVRKRVRFIRPGCLRIDQVGSGDTYVLYFDGAAGWEILPGGTFAALAGGEFEICARLSGRPESDLLVGRPRPGQGDHIPCAALNVIAISSKVDSGQRTEITLDPVTLLPVKQTGITNASSDRPVHQEMRFDHWQVFGGVKFPGLFLNFHDGRKLAEGTVERTIVNSGLKPADLALKPPDLKPVMSQP
jgi:hypothetical protein